MKDCNTNKRKRCSRKLSIADVARRRDLTFERLASECEWRRNGRTRARGKDLVPVEVGRSTDLPDRPTDAVTDRPTRDRPTEPVTDDDLDERLFARTRERWTRSVISSVHARALMRTSLMRTRNDHGRSMFCTLIPSVAKDRLQGPRAHARTTSHSLNDRCRRRRPSSSLTTPDS